MSGILSDLDMNEPRRRKPTWPTISGAPGLLVRHRSTGYVGTVTKCTSQWITILDQSGRTQTVHNEKGAFSVDGRSVSLAPPRPKRGPAEAAVTASGSVAVPNAKARVAQPSRILVEGMHDAELVEKVWGHDLRIEGVVVEPLHGADDLGAVVTNFRPGPHKRLGILLDHLIDGTKETHIARAVSDSNVLITGHPYVDVWQAVRPEVLGIKAWPTVPRGTDWKTGICSAFGFEGPPRQLWKTILGRVSGYQDLEPGLVGAVEELIDFVSPLPND